MEGWSCCWNQTRTDICYVGLRNGTVAEYDVRAPSVPVKVYDNVQPCPLISLQYVGPNGTMSGDSVTPPGLLCASLKSCHFIPLTPVQESFNDSIVALNSDGSKSDHKILPFSGLFMSGQFDTDSGYGLLTSRPTDDRKNVTHFVSSINSTFEWFLIFFVAV